MARFEVAHVRVQGTEVTLVVVDSTFPEKSTSEQALALKAFQVAATAAGMRGSAVVVWDQGGRVASFGLRRWQRFLQNLDWTWVESRVNRKLIVE